MLLFVFFRRKSNALPPPHLIHCLERFAHLAFLVWFGISAILPREVGTDARNQRMLPDLVATGLVIDSKPCSSQVGSPVTGYPITYAAGSKQYVAVSTGNSLVSTGLNRLAPELHPSNASNIFVFALP